MIQRGKSITHRVEYLTELCFCFGTLEFGALHRRRIEEDSKTSDGSARRIADRKRMPGDRDALTVGAHDLSTPVAHDSIRASRNLHRQIVGGHDLPVANDSEVGRARCGGQRRVLATRDAEQSSEMPVDPYARGGSVLSERDPDRDCVEESRIRERHYLLIQRIDAV
ncbi:MAG TPA: hypothetical protein VKE51_18230 [Vicinamibacterales bacterium]|nr:hypothetical protein [Vicinamibacterales bacterium]